MIFYKIVRGNVWRIREHRDIIITDRIRRIEG
jgi:hypothetical protein